MSRRAPGACLFDASQAVRDGDGRTPLPQRTTVEFVDRDGAEVRVSLSRDGVIEVYYTTNMAGRYLVTRPTSSNTFEIHTVEL